MSKIIVSLKRAMYNKTEKKNVDIKIENEKLASQGCKDNYKKLLFKCTPIAKERESKVLL